MDLALQQSLGATPWNLERHRKLGSSPCRSSSPTSSVSSRMALLMARKSRLRGIRCISENGEGSGTSEENPKSPIGSWNNSSSPSSDRFSGWALHESQRNGLDTSGWIKIGGVVLLGIGFSLGARSLHSRKDTPREFAATPPTVEAMSTSKSLEDVNAKSTADTDGAIIQYSSNEEDESFKEQTETHVNDTVPDTDADDIVPDTHVQEKSVGENIEQIDSLASTGNLAENDEPQQVVESDTPLLSEDIVVERTDTNDNAIDTSDIAVAVVIVEDIAERNATPFVSEIFENTKEDSSPPSIVLITDDSLKETLSITEHQESLPATAEESVSAPLGVHTEDDSLKEILAVSEVYQESLSNHAIEDSSVPYTVLTEDNSQHEVLVREHQETLSVLSAADVLLIDDDSGKSEQSLEVVLGQKDDDIYEAEATRPSVQSEHVYLSAGITAPRTPSSQLPKTGRVIVGASVDHMQEQVVTALQGLKVMEPDIDLSSICKRRDYARWLIGASGALSRSPSHKVFPAMYIENVTKLAYDDVKPDDPDFPFIQGLAEAGLISSRLLQDDSLQAGSLDQIDSTFSPDSPLTRQDLLTWKVASEWKPVFSSPISATKGKEKLREACGFIDIDKIHQDAIPALLEDASRGERSIVALAFGYTRRFQPEKPVTKSQAAIALSTGEAWDVLSEELARIEADSIAEAAVVAELALEKRAQQEMAAEFEGLLQAETEKHQAATKLVEMMKAELEQLKLERDEEKYALLKERALLDAEKEFVSSLRREVDSQALALSIEKSEAGFEREKAKKLLTQAESEKAVISELRSAVEVEKSALTLARVWAEDEARKAQSQLKILEEMRKKSDSEALEGRASERSREVREPLGAENGKVSEEERSAKSVEIEGVKKVDKGADLQATEVKLPQLSIDGLVAKSKHIAEALAAMVLRWLQLVYLLLQTVQHRLAELARGAQDRVHEARIHGTSIITQVVEDVRTNVPKTVEEFKAKVPVAVAGVTSHVRDGTSKVVDGWREGAERLGHKLGIPSSEVK